MKDIKNIISNLKVGNVVELTQRLAHTPDVSFTQKDGYAEKIFKVTINYIQDKEDSCYIGYTPLDFKNGRHGCFVVRKTMNKKFGVVAINGTELY